MSEAIFDQRLLETFVHVAEAGTISHGARQVHRTQSTVSAQIAKLEEEAGARLFERGARELTLTPTGVRLLGLAQEILEVNRRARAALHGASAPTPLRFGCSQYYRPQELPQIIARAQRAFPEFSLEVTLARSTQLGAMLAAGELDAAIVSSTRAVTGSRLLHREPLVWAAARGFRLHAGEPLPLVALGGECELRGVALAALAKARLSARIVFSSTSATGILAALEAGLGVACLNAGAVLPSLTQIPSGPLPALPKLGFHALQRVKNPAWRRFLDDLARR